MAKQFKKPESGRPAASGFFAPTKNINNLPRHVLLKRLIYDPFTGVFRWKKPPCAKIKANDIAGHLNKNGYRRIRIDGVYYLAHRLAWLYVYGYMPENEIDHKDRNPKNNAISNLRESSHQCNMRNSKKQKNNQSGVTGVYFVKSRGKWAARIWIDDKCVFLGHHDDFVLAVRARWEAEKKYGFIGCNSTSTAFLYLKKQGLGGVFMKKHPTNLKPGQIRRGDYCHRFQSCSQKNKIDPKQIVCLICHRFIPLFAGVDPLAQAITMGYKVGFKTIKAALAFESKTDIALQAEAYRKKLSVHIKESGIEKKPAPPPQPDPAPRTKKCGNPRCKDPVLPAPPKYFYRNRTNVDGLSRNCKVCQNAAQKKSLIKKQEKDRRNAVAGFLKNTRWVKAGPPIGREVSNAQ